MVAIWLTWAIVTIIIRLIGVAVGWLGVVVQCIAPRLVLTNTWIYMVGAVSFK